MKLAITILLACTSCMSVGNRFDLTASADLRHGMTLEQVEDTLGGEPTSRAILADGRMACVWLHSNGMGSTKSLSLVFDPNGHLLRRQ